MRVKDEINLIMSHIGKLFSEIKDIKEKLNRIETPRRPRGRPPGAKNLTMEEKAELRKKESSEA